MRPARIYRARWITRGICITRYRAAVSRHRSMSIHFFVRAGLVCVDYLARLAHLCTRTSDQFLPLWQRRVNGAFCCRLDHYICNVSTGRARAGHRCFWRSVQTSFLCADIRMKSFRVHVSRHVRTLCEPGSISSAILQLLSYHIVIARFFPSAAQLLGIDAK